MKFAPVLLLCLAVAVQQAAAKPFIFEGIADGVRTAGSVAQGIAGTAGSVASGVVNTAGSIASGVAQGVSGVAQGAIGTASGIAKGVIGAGTGVIAGVADQAASAVKNIGEKVQDVRNKVLKGAMQQAQNTLQKVQDSTRGALEASETVAKHKEEAIIEIENQKNEIIQEWADKAQNKLADASPETQKKGQNLIDGFVTVRSEAIKEATDNAVETLEGLQEKASATANQYHEPMNKLIEQVGKCSEIKASQIRELIKCGSEIQKDLAPLASAPRDLAAVKGQLLKAGAQNIARHVNVQKAMNEFRDQSKQVEAILDQLVAEDKKNQEQNDEEADDEAADDEAPQDEAADDEAPQDEAPEEESPADEE